MSFEVITYATHSERMFPELMDSGYPIKVLGWGEKWENFLTKIKGVLDYVKTKNPDDIVVCVDGFDTNINGDPREAEKIFKSMNCGFLISNDLDTNFFNNLRMKFYFGTCQGEYIANMGIWMGYVKYVIPILESILSKKCGDDQINFNSICGEYEFIKIDVENKIFLNKTRKDTRESIFHGYPGTAPMKLSDIKNFLYNYLGRNIVVFSLILFLLSTLFPPMKYLWIPTIAVFLFYSDKSCTFT